MVKLDDVLYIDSSIGNMPVKYYGIVGEVHKFLEGAEFVYDAHGATSHLPCLLKAHPLASKTL